MMSLEVRTTVTSTMDVARENIVSGRLQFNQLGQLRYDGIVAQEQTAGRGQRGRAWYALPGESLCATYYFRRGLTDPQHASQIALLAGLAVAEAIRFPFGALQEAYVRRHRRQGRQLSAETYARLAATFGPAPLPTPSPDEPALGLKWPNDLLLNGKKVGGILIEMVRASDGDWVALIGTGINLRIRDFPPELATTATSLLREGLPPERWQGLAERIAICLHAWADLRGQEGFAIIRENWQRYDQTPGRVFRTEMDGRLVQGVAEGIDSSGALQLRLEDGRLVAVTSATSLRERRLLTADI